jgi:hypothetical protein
MLLKLLKKFICPEDGGHTQGSEQRPELVGPVNKGRSAEVENTLDANREVGSRRRQWIGVDLDGTLAYYSGWQGLDHIGAPIPAIRARMEEWISQGFEVRIFTARASLPEGIKHVKRWLREYGFPDLEVTNQKDFDMLELWDDRAVQVVPNTGSPVLSSRFGALPRAPLFGIEHREKKPTRSPFLGGGKHVVPIPETSH